MLVNLFVACQSQCENTAAGISFDLCRSFHRKLLNAVVPAVCWVSCDVHCLFFIVSSFRVLKAIVASTCLNLNESMNYFCYVVIYITGPQNLKIDHVTLTTPLFWNIYTVSQKRRHYTHVHIFAKY